MKLRTRILALMLCVSILLSLCGCLPIPIVQDALDELREEPQTAQEQTQAEPEEEIETLAGDGYFEPLARDERFFDEMQLGEITCEAYAPYCEAITAAAEEKALLDVGVHAPSPVLPEFLWSGGELFRLTDEPPYRIKAW